jgi:mycothiol synthase
VRHVVEALTIASQPTLDGSEQAAVRRLAERAVRHDGTYPLNEAAALHLGHPRSGVTHILASGAADPAEDSASLAGYAQLDSDDTVSVAHLVVDPAQRQQGIGRRLLRDVVRLAPTPVQIWAPGNSPAAQALAAAAGFRPRRELLIMKRRLGNGSLRKARVPAGITIRTFRPGADDQDWLEVNAEAFADHPEQGRLTADDLAERMAEPWFDAEGFFVAHRARTMVGFHWTKQHGDHLGEVYVLGVVPTAAGEGVGKALLTVGLQHLEQQGNTTVELYVEADHPDAVGLYHASGFRIADRDVMYAQPPNVA